MQNEFRSTEKNLWSKNKWLCVVRNAWDCKSPSDLGATPTKWGCSKNVSTPVGSTYSFTHPYAQVSWRGEFIIHAIYLDEYHTKNRGLFLKMTTKWQWEGEDEKMQEEKNIVSNGRAKWRLKNRFSLAWPEFNPI